MFYEIKAIMEQFRHQYPWGFKQGYYNIRVAEEWEDSDLIIEGIFGGYSISIKGNSIKVFYVEGNSIIENKIRTSLSFDLNRTLHYIYLTVVKDVDYEFPIRK